MPRGGHRVKPAKVAQVGTSVSSSTADIPPMATKSTKENKNWKIAIAKTAFLSRSLTESKLAAASPPVQVPPRSHDEATPSPTIKIHLPVEATHTQTSFECNERLSAMPNGLLHEQEGLVQMSSGPDSSSQTIEKEEDTCEAISDTFDDLSITETQSSASSLYSRDSASIYSSDSASIYSSASSIYSSGASIYSQEEETENSLDARLSGRLQYQQRTRTTTVRRQEPQDAASRERSTLARKAAMFKNSRLPPELPSFTTPLPTWSMVCRAAQASLECYDSQALTRRGTYTPADTAKDIKAMIVDDQYIDNTRFIIVSIRGTQFKCLADWSVNKAANPEKPIGFLDDEENACHAGFLQVTKAMVNQVAAQLQQHPASSEKPSLLFTGHSAGGAVAAMLYSHMLSTSVQSPLTSLASHFPSINCVTFGAPPLSLTPLPTQPRASGVFLSFANQGDPVLRLSNAAYVKSLAKLMTASPPASATGTVAPPPVKVVRQSRGTRIIRTTFPTAPPTPWEELPVWPTPPAPLTNAGDIVLLRDTAKGNASASKVTSEDLEDVIFGDLAQHTIEMYIRRVRDVAFAAMVGREGD